MNDHRVDVSIATATRYDENNCPETQIDLLGGGGCAPGEAYHPFGFIGRAPDPDIDAATGQARNGARVLYWYEGSTLHTVGLDDPRRTAKLPQVDKGGSMMYADADGAYARYSADGTLEVRAPAGKTVTVQVGGGAMVKIDDVTVKIGDDAARALVHAQETLAILAALVAEIAADLTNLNTNGPISFLAYYPGKVASLTALQSAIAAQIATLPTTKAMGT